MTNKEIKEKLANMFKDKYIYQRYDGRITKYRVSGEYYINVESGIAINKNRQMLIGKVSENLIDLAEVGDYVNGKRVFATENRINDNGEKVVLSENYNEWTDDGVISNHDIKTILTHELYEASCYKEGGEE